MASGRTSEPPASRPPWRDLVALYPFLAVDAEVRRWTTGGFSGAQIWRCRTADHTWCIRQWPAGVPAERIAWVHDVVRRVADSGFGKLAVPVMYPLGGSVARIQDGCFEVAPWLPGRADYGVHPTPARCEAAMHALAEFHLFSAKLSDLTAWRMAPSVERRRRLGQAWATARLPELKAAMQSSRGAPLLTEAWQIVDACEPMLRGRDWRLDGPTAPVFVQPCLRDIWHEHVLFTNDRVTGLVDYDALQIDSPATDVARLLASLACDNPHAWQSGLEAYNRVRPLSAAEGELLHWLHGVNLPLSGLQWCDWLFLQQRDFPDLEAVRRRLLHFLTRLQAAT